MTPLETVQAACRECRRCVDEGIIPVATPTFSGRVGNRMMLVGQAPGPTERASRRPFSGRAGKELDRWMVRAGFESAEEFRDRVYICAMARCFPGRNEKAGGDLRPSPRMVANCADWLDAELRLLAPRVILAVGRMAVERFGGRGALADLVGVSIGDNPVVIPLPHPSGQSRWLNDPGNRERLERALDEVSRWRVECLTTRS